MSYNLERSFGERKHAHTVTEDGVGCKVKALSGDHPIRDHLPRETLNHRSLIVPVSILYLSPFLFLTLGHFLLYTLLVKIVLQRYMYVLVCSLLFCTKNNNYWCVLKIVLFYDL